jgi:hypothetical protein
MSTANREQLNDLFDTRAEVRRLQKVVKDTRAAASEARSELAAASSRAEGILTEMEQKQGRLAFEGDDAQPAKRPRKQAGGAQAENHAG